MSQVVREKVPGILLFISCHKYLNLRIKEFVPKGDSFEGWKIHIVVGNPFIQDDFILCGRLIILKCEDSYFHLLKKLALAMSALHEMYDMEHGILRCNDDLMFDYAKLKKFILSDEKGDYMGRLNRRGNIVPPIFDDWNAKYAETHVAEFSNPLNGLNGVDLSKYTIRPDVTYFGGPIIYLSVKASKLISEHMKKINYNGFLGYKECGYPYLLEDIGIGFIMQTNGIEASVRMDFWTEGREEGCLTFHTNKYK